MLIAQEIAFLAQRLSHSIPLHMRAEEEELLPVLNANFSKEEVRALVGKVMGERPLELIVSLMQMVMRGLPEGEQQGVIQDMQEAALGTYFEDWLKDLHRMNGIVGGNSSQANHQHAGHHHPTTNHHHNPTTNHHHHPTTNHTNQQQHLIHIPLGSIDGACLEHRADGHFGCQHYSKKCKLLAPCCNKLYTCRQCHDADNTHTLPRSSITKIWCMQCHTLQDESSQCIQCHLNFSSYHCSTCHLHEDNANKNIYHCPYCNVCRVGQGLGKDYFHCMQCNACISTSLREHKCVSKSTERSCPICLDDMFSSALPVHYLKCGHALHSHCFTNTLRNDFKCPSCRKTMVDMSQYWAQLEEANSVTSFVKGQCVDCECTGAFQGYASECMSSKFGPKCTGCGSHNTSLVR